MFGPYVTRKSVGDISLSVDDARIALRNGYWRVPVRPSREPNPLSLTTRRLRTLKTRYKKKKALKSLSLPAIQRMRMSKSQWKRRLSG